MTILGMIRHGVTDWNMTGRWQGQTDVPLNEEGKRQARALAKYLERQPIRWDVIYSSNLQRAIMTADLISEMLNLGEVRIDERLKERGFGLAEGLTLAERHERFGEDISAIEGVEPEHHILQRGHDFLRDLLRNEKGRNVLIVSHGAFLKRVFGLLVSGLPDLYIDNASITIFEQSEDGWRVRLHNGKAEQTGISE